MQRADDNPMRPDWRIALGQAGGAPRCRAHSKRTGLPCQGPAMRGWTVCRMHGAGGGHAAGSSHPTWAHGARSQKAVETRRAANELMREASETAALIR